MIHLLDRLLGALGALAGAAGIVLLAAGAHVDAAGNLTTAGWMALAHAGVILFLAGTTALRPALRRLGALGLLAGVVLFSGDLAARSHFGQPLFPMAAPTGGSVLIGSWLLLVFACLAGARRT
jgi:Uncharacterized small membrane protein